MAEYEPSDSRNVTGTASTPDGRWTQQQKAGQPGAGQQQAQQGTGDATSYTAPHGQAGGMASQNQMEQQSGQMSGQQGAFSDPGATGTGDMYASSGQQQQSGSGSGQQGGFDSPGIADEFAGGNAAQTGTSGQQSQFDSSSAGQMGGGSGSTSQFASQIREHMEVIGADGVHVGTVDEIEGNRIKLTKKDSGMGSHQGHHHYLPLSLVSGVDGNQVRLSANGDVAYGMEGEE